MGRKKKEINKDGAFQVRFRRLWSKSKLTQEALAEKLGVSRPTVVGWLDGKNIPDIYSLEKIARYFRVSADYLLGLSNTVSADINLRAAVEYTGLSEAAVEWLHIGLDDFECDGVGLAEETKRDNLNAASALIQDRAFTQIIHHLKEVSLEAYLERILDILNSEYSECDLPEEDPNFRYARQEDRETVVSNHIHVLETKRPETKEAVRDMVTGMDDEELACDVIRALFSAKESNELHQFHAGKAFTGYIDRLVAEGYQKAEKRFAK